MSKAKNLSIRKRPAVVPEMVKPVKKTGGRRAVNRELRNDAILARNLRFYRIKAGMSQTAVAEQLGLTFQQVQKYEKGTNAMAPGRVRQAAALFSIPIGNLFAERGREVNEAVTTDFNSRAYETLAAINVIKSARVQRAIGNLLTALVQHQEGIEEP